MKSRLRTSREPVENKGKTTDQQSLAPHLLHDDCQDEAEPAAVLAAWPMLPQAIRSDMTAMLRAASAD
jgi:hypothetical protein